MQRTTGNEAVPTRDGVTGSETTARHARLGRFSKEAGVELNVVGMRVQAATDFGDLGIRVPLCAQDRRLRSGPR